MVGRHYRRLFSRRAAIVAGMSAAAAIAVMLYLFHPLLLGGPAVWRLSTDDRVAYLILADQLAASARVSGLEDQQPLPVTVGTSVKLCYGASDDLIAALKSSGADRGLHLVTWTCDTTPRTHLFVGVDGEHYSGGYICGPLCGAGNDYQVWRFLGLSRVARTASFVM